MSEENIDLGSDLEKLAHAMLEDAVKEGVKLSERLDVFKILSTHYVNLEKVKGKNATPPGVGMTMDSLRGRVAEGSGSTISDEEEEEDEPPSDS